MLTPSEASYCIADTLLHEAAGTVQDEACGAPIEIGCTSAATPARALTPRRGISRLEFACGSQITLSPLSLAGSPQHMLLALARQRSCTRSERKTHRCQSARACQLAAVPCCQAPRCPLLRATTAEDTAGTAARRPLSAAAPSRRCCHPRPALATPFPPPTPRPAMLLRRNL